MKFILGKKKEMTQIFNPEDGFVLPVTLVKAGPCVVVRIKTKDSNDGYNAVQIGFETKKSRHAGESKEKIKLGLNSRYIREFRTDNLAGLSSGDAIGAGVFNVGDKVKVAGVSKGKGFQGVVKRHGFHGQRATHGNKDQERAPGSIGSTEPARVFPGMRMPGHMGDSRVTVKNLTIVKVDSENNELYIKGAIPGARGSLVMISGDGEMDLKQGGSKLNENKKGGGQSELGKDKKVEELDVAQSKDKTGQEGLPEIKEKDDKLIQDKDNSVENKHKDN